MRLGNIIPFEMVLWHFIFISWSGIGCEALAVRRRYTLSSSPFTPLLWFWIAKKHKAIDTIREQRRHPPRRAARLFAYYTKLTLCSSKQQRRRNFHQGQEQYFFIFLDIYIIYIPVLISRELERFGIIFFCWFHYINYYTGPVGNFKF